MIFEEFEANSVGRRHLQCSWRFELDADDPDAIAHAIVPDGTVTIVVEQAVGHAVRPVLMGPSMRAHKVAVWQGVIYLGIRLRPGAVMPLLGIPAGRLRDRIEPMAMSRPDLAARIAGAVEGSGPDQAIADLEGCVAALSLDAPEPDAIVSLAVAAIVDSHGERSVASIAAMTGLSERQLRRRFVKAVALLPKEFSRIQRLRRTWTLALDQTQARWSTISADTGFADQAHLTREIGRSFGCSPREVETYLRMIRHRLADPISMSEKFKTMGAVRV